MKVTPIGKDLHSMHGVVQILHSNSSFFFSGIYASPKYRRRKITWSELKDMSTSINLPWIVIGDFNEVRNQNDQKLGGNPVNLNRCNAFNSCISESGLIDVGSTRLKFTWLNKPNRRRIQEKLDRALVNSSGFKFGQTPMQ